MVSGVLTLLREGEVLKTYPIDKETSLGRAESCSIQLNDRAISRLHAILKPSLDGVQVQKKSSFGSLLVNGTDCLESMIKEGDVVSLGPYQIKFTLKKEVSSMSEEAESGIPGEPLPLPTEALSVSVQSSGSVEELIQEASDFKSQSDSLDSEAQSGALDSKSQSDFINSKSQSVSLQSKSQSHFMDLKPQSNIEDQEIPIPTPETPSTESYKIILADENAKTRVNFKNKIIAKLIFPSGGANFSEYEIKKEEISIGRGKECDIVLNDKKSSRKHAVIKNSGLSYVIQDLNSSNGTYVDGNKINEQILSGDETIQIGEVIFNLMVEDSEYHQKEKEFITPIVTEEVRPFIPESPPFLSQVSSPSLKVGFFQKISRDFKSLSPIRIVIYLGVLVGAYFVLFVEAPDEQAKRKVASTKKTVEIKKESGEKTPFNTTLKDPTIQLTAEQRKFVEDKHDLAFNYLKNKEYDKALFEIRKIFSIVSDYKNSKEIERYAMDGKRRVEALEEEKKKKEEETQFKAKVEQLIQETKERMAHRDYEQARELMDQILSQEPDNAQVAKWKSEISEYEESIRAEAEKKRFRDVVRDQMQEAFKRGLRLKKQGNFYAAISVFEKIRKNSFDPKISKKSIQMIQACKTELKNRLEPLLKEGKEKEDAGQYKVAYELYKKAHQVDGRSPASFSGMNRVYQVLNDKAKAAYTEGVLAESYSDFSTSKRKFKECLEVAPLDSVYFERAQNKLSHYFKKDGEEGFQ